jgi:TonB family protein
VAPTPQPVKVLKTSTVLNGKAVRLPKPRYPEPARIIKASGAVNVQVLLDETGKVISAQAVSGHPLLRRAAVEAAYQALFTPTILGDQPVKVSGVITYNFVF